MNKSTTTSTAATSTPLDKIISKSKISDSKSKLESPSSRFKTLVSTQLQGLDVTSNPDLNLVVQPYLLFLWTCFQNIEFIRSVKSKLLNSNSSFCASTLMNANESLENLLANCIRNESFVKNYTNSKSDLSDIQSIELDRMSTINEKLCTFYVNFKSYIDDCLKECKLLQLPSYIFPEANINYFEITFQQSISRLQDLLNSITIENNKKESFASLNNSSKSNNSSTTIHSELDSLTTSISIPQSIYLLPVNFMEARKGKIAKVIQPLPGGNILLSNSDRSIHIVNNQGQVIADKSFAFLVSSVVALSENRLLFSAVNLFEQQFQLCLVSMPDFEIIQVYTTLHRDWIFTATLCPNKRYYITGGTGEISLWDLESKQGLSKSIAFSELLSVDGKGKIVDWMKDSELSSSPPPLAPKSRSSSSISFFFSTFITPTTFALSGTTNGILIYSISDISTPLHRITNPEFRGPAFHLSYIPRMDWLLTTTQHGEIWGWNARDKSLAYMLKLEQSAKGFFIALPLAVPKKGEESVFRAREEEDDIEEETEVDTLFNIASEAVLNHNLTYQEKGSLPQELIESLKCRQLDRQLETVIAIASVDSTITLLDLSTSKTLYTMKLGSPIAKLAYHPIDRLLIATTLAGYCEVFQVTSIMLYN